MAQSQMLHSSHVVEKYTKITCLADGVMPICTTMMARVIFSSCILWQYILIVLIPTLASSEKSITHFRVSEGIRSPIITIEYLILTND